MGVDLRIMPLERHDMSANRSMLLGMTILEFVRRRELWEPIQSIPSNPVGSGRLRSYFAQREDGEFEWGTVDEDCYGKELRWVPAGKLASVVHQHNDLEAKDIRERAASYNVPQTNLAIAEYLSALDPETPVVLFWH